MKLLTAILFLSAVVSGQSQRQMTDTACAGYHKADAELSRTLEGVIASHASDDSFVKAFRASQEAWVAFRESHIKALYPEHEGSITPMCKCYALEDMTRDRIAQIRNLWVKGAATGDACSGSMPIKRR